MCTLGEIIGKIGRDVAKNVKVKKDSDLATLGYGDWGTCMKNNILILLCHCIVFIARNIPVFILFQKSTLL